MGAPLARPSRTSARIRIFATALATAVAGAACTSAPATAPTNAWCGMKVGLFGTLEGPWGPLTLSSVSGTRLRFQQHNDANPACPIHLVEHSVNAGVEPADAAESLLADPAVLGVIGGHFDTETDATIPIYQDGGLAMISPMATRDDLTGRPGVTVFHRLTGPRAPQVQAIAAYLHGKAATSVYIIDDRSSYGTQLADELVAMLGPETAYTRYRVPEQGYYFFPEMAAEIANVDPDVIVFAAHYGQVAGPSFIEVRAVGVTAPFIGVDGLWDPAIVDQTGGAAVGALLTCACAPATGAFADEYATAYGAPPGLFAGLGYDAASIFIDVITSGATTRAAVLAGVKAYDRPGVSKHLRFDAAGDAVAPEIWLYRVTAEGLDPLGRQLPA